MKITQFSITQYKIDNADINDIRPRNHYELMRYCCNLKEGKHEIKNILFKDTFNYSWSLCRLDTSLVSNHLLNSLSLKQKLEYLERLEKINQGLKLDSFKIPFEIERGFVYQIFGLPDLNGSFYFRLDTNDKLVMQYQDGGPF